MKRMSALFLGIILLFSLALAEGAKAVPAESENIMVPRQFMSMFNTVLEISAEKMRGSWGNEETDRLVKQYSLTEYDYSPGTKEVYYGSEGWTIETVFVFENEEDVSFDNPVLRWYLCLDDEADENAARLTMYSLNQMLGYTYDSSLGADAVQHYFSTFTLGEKLELPDGYEFVIFRPEGEDYAVFAMQPAMEN